MRETATTKGEENRDLGQVGGVTTGPRPPTTQAGAASASPRNAALPDAALAQAHTALARTRDVAGALEGLIDVLTDPDERALHRVTRALHTTRREAQEALLDAQELADRTLDGLGPER